MSPRPVARVTPVTVVAVIRRGGGKMGEDGGGRMETGHG